MPACTEQWKIVAHTEYGINFHLTAMKGIITLKGYLSVADFWLLAGVEDKEFNDYVEAGIGWWNTNDFKVENRGCQWVLILPHWGDLW